MPTKKQSSKNIFNNFVNFPKSVYHLDRNLGHFLLSIQECEPLIKVLLNLSTDSESNSDNADPKTYL